MSTFQLVLGLALVVSLLAWWWRSRRRTGSPGEDEVDRIDTLIGWPPQATRVLTTQERVTFGILVRALPEYMILAQVPLSRFLNVPKRNSYADWLRRLGYQCADFVVCDMAAQVVAVIEVRAAHPTERSRKRLARMARTLKAAKIPLQTWSENALPAVDAVRAAILPRAGPARTATPVAAARAFPAAAAPAGVAFKKNPFDDSRRDSTQDELIELLEPPPSTWFDELDSDVAPLRKN